MEKNLEKIDLAIDANAVIFERCMDSVINLTRRFNVPVMDGPDQSSISSEAIVQATVAIFERVSDVISGASCSEIVKEYMIEKQKEREDALNASKGVETHADQGAGN